MKELNFLKKLKRKRVIELVESSEEMKSSYLIKSENCLKSAKILFQSQLYENSTSEAYYCMYNSLLLLLSGLFGSLNILFLKSIISFLNEYTNAAEPLPISIPPKTSEG